MRSRGRWLGMGWLLIAPALAAAWQPVGEAGWPTASEPLAYVQRTLERPRDAQTVTAHLALFRSSAYRLTVLDRGAHTASLPDAFRDAGIVAGVNGGFFHSDGRPLGLVIAQGQRINRVETTRLLSGVLYGDDRGIHLLRRARFRDHPGIDALVQSGPYLVENGRAVRGLSAKDASQRTFVATDWRGHWVLGATRTPLTLADLAECLSAPGALTPWPVERALNLDGGSSSGFFFDRGTGVEPVAMRPWKPVRNLIGLRPR
ncbi:phosphodiester glycosidase family protein [uncultured Thiocystis sp.]|uniref:phosphodiester glycosidase family protein n=1 Tax=uncultured Thiocystis sp. TaxID=1202134 RepID=UPI0025E98619|nr:phosphodiester glycosidase family protein [uncultured Thiocystis sp.]